MSIETTEVKIEIDDEEEKSASDFVTTNIISYDSLVTCGKCKKRMTYQEYDSNHSSSHYHLCWIDGVEGEIDFSDTFKVQSILRESLKNCTTKLKLKCEWCNEIKLTISGYANHLKKCKNNPVLSMSDAVLDKSPIKYNDLVPTTSTSTHNDESMVSCGRCQENMTYAEYKNEHRYKHYNLCWLNSEEKIDFSNENNTVVLLREILPKLSEKVKKICFICEWCEEKRKTLVGFASHVKKCAIEQNLISLPESEETNSNQPMDEKCNSNSMVTCGRCNQSLSYKEYEESHKYIHYNLCWINGDDKPNFDDETITKHLLRQTLPKHAARQKKVNFICEWCQVTKKSVPGFASHIKRCQLRPDKESNVTKSEDCTVLKSDIEIIKDRDASIVTCGRCNEEMTFQHYRTDHLSKHNNLCWIIGEEKPDFENYDTVLTKLKQLIPFSVVRKRSVKLICEECKSVKKSIAGFASHVIFCNKTDSDIKSLLLRCSDCGNKVKPSSLLSHKLKNCKGMSKLESGDDSTNDRSDPIENGFYKMRRRRRPPNILSFHPDTKFVSEHFDCMCRLCDFVSMSVNDIISHVLSAHNIDLNNATNHINLEKYILSTYGAQKNIYLKPLFNYYNFFKKTFWKTICHEDFKPEIQILNNNEAIKYLPSIQQSCKLFNSDNEQICVDLFKSTYVNGILWLFTGGPNWAMSWCPVPEEVKTQYLAISCHPKPDLEHKEMEIYKYPSLVQLWIFNSLTNINHEPISDLPYMSYGLAHEFGAVWDMAWCPSGAYEPKKKIGLLALSTSCGDCPVFAMPFVDGNPEMFYIYKAKPVIARNFECEWIENGVQCTKVCWQVVAPFKTLICGYSNGIVSVFNINFKSIFMNDDILYPSHTFRASRCTITGLSTNYLNSSILATTAIDGIVSLWDLKSTESSIFQKKAYSPSDCTWLQQCCTLVYCSKGVNSLFLKVRTVNFSNCDDDFDGYNPELNVLKAMTNKGKVINDYNTMNPNSNEKSNCDDADVSLIGRKSKRVGKTSTLDVSNTNSDNESYKCEESSSNSDEEKTNNAVKSGDVSKNIDEEDYYGPTFFQRNTHWSLSTSDWMNLIATGDESGSIYEKLFLPETNNLRKGNSTTLQLIVKKLVSNDTSQSTYSNGYRFKETVEHFGIESKFFLFDENLPNLDESKPLLRYPLDNITKVSWNQNFSSFRWLAIGTQSGFTLVSPSQAISDNCIQSFYKSTLTTIKKEC